MRQAIAPRRITTVPHRHHGVKERGKKSTSFRVDEVVLGDLSAKADRLSERTGRSYSIATIVDTALARAAQEPDDDTIAEIAKYRLGVDVMPEPPGRFADLLDRFASLTRGTGHTPHRLLSADWVDVSPQIQIEGLHHRDIAVALRAVIATIRRSPSSVKQTLDRYISENSYNELVEVLYRLHELATGGPKQQDLLDDLVFYYLCVSVFGHPDIQAKVNDLIRTDDKRNVEEVEVFRRLMEIGGQIYGRISANR